MTGVIKRIPKSQTGLANYAFIETIKDGEYFLHASGFTGNWDDLVDALNQSPNKYLKMEFDVVASPRGPRALNAKIISEVKDGSK